MFYIFCRSVSASTPANLRRSSQLTSSNAKLIWKWWVLPAVLSLLSLSRLPKMRSCFTSVRDLKADERFRSFVVFRSVRQARRREAVVPLPWCVVKLSPCLVSLFCCASNLASVWRSERSFVHRLPLVRSSMSPLCFAFLPSLFLRETYDSLLRWWIA